MRRATARSFQGSAFAVGAPLGWLLLQRARGASLVSELNTNPQLYIYMLVGTMLAFGLFGLVLGRQEDELLKINRRLGELAITDSLTGLRNFRYFFGRFEEEHAEHMRTGEPLAVVIIDLDHFKRVNDEYGHLVGDDVLISAAQALAGVTRQGETAARVGGEEFALLLPASTSEKALDAAERVRQAIAASTTPVRDREQITLRVTASAGVASTADLGELGLNELYRAADVALYRAKAEGRNRTVVAGTTNSRPHPESSSL